MDEEYYKYLLSLKGKVKEYDLINAGILSLNYSECQLIVEFVKSLRDDVNERLKVYEEDNNR